MTMPIDKAISQFLRWYVGEHARGGKCKWAVSLMASFQYYFEQIWLSPGPHWPGSAGAFKTWRRENNIHDNSLRKQLLLLGQFFIVRYVHPSRYGLRDGLVLAPAYQLRSWKRCW